MFRKERTGVRVLLALLAGAVTSLAFAPLESRVALFVGWLLYGALLLRTEKRGHAFLVGWAFGFGWFLPGLHWVLHSIVEYGHLPFVLGAAGLVLFALFLALFPAFAALLAARWRTSPATYGLLAFPFWNTVFEAIRTDVVRFGWLSPAYGTLDTWWSDWARIGGVDWVNFGFFLTVGAVLTLLFGRTVKGRVTGVLLAVLVLAGGWGIGSFSWSTPTAPTWFRLVQPGLIVTNRPTVAENAGRLDYVTDFVKDPWPEESRGRRAVLFSESVVTVPVTSLPAADLERLRTLALRADAPVLFTGLRREGNAVYNTAYWMDGKGWLTLVDKRRLVPFGEYVPSALRWLPELFGVRIGDMTPGAGNALPQTIGEAKVATLICFENLFGTLLPELFAGGNDPTHLAVVSNLGWFSSAAKGQHLAISRLRAIESARPILSVNNNGDSSVIDAEGRVLLRFVPEGSQVETIIVEGASGDPTPFIRWGNLLRALLYLVALLFLLAFGVRTKRAWRSNDL